MRILLKNNGGYAGMEFVQFPVEVEGKDNGEGCYQVECSELVRVGADADFFCDEHLWNFVTGVHLGVIE